MPNARGFALAANSSLSTTLVNAMPGRAWSIQRTPLPDDTAVASGSAAAVQGLVDQAAMTGTYSAGANAPPALSFTNFGSGYKVVGRNQPYIKIAVTQPQSALESDPGFVWVPLPTNAIPQGDSDSTYCLYQPGYRHGPGGAFQGRYWEFTGLYAPTAPQLAAGATFQTRNLMRMIDADNNIGRMYDYFFQAGITFDAPATDPYAVPDEREGVMQYRVWGASAVGANPPFITQCIQAQDILRGYCTHPIGLVTCNHGVRSKWPAQADRYDGTLTSYPFQAGDWFRYPANATMPGNLTPMGELLWRTIQKYGLIVVDKSLTCLAIRANADCAPLAVGPGSSHDGRDWSAYPYTNLQWGGMELMVAGDDGTFHPRRNNKVSTGIGAIATPQLWFDASAQPAQADNTDVLPIDFSGNGRNTRQTKNNGNQTVSNPPKYRTNVVNGKPAFQFTTASSQGLAFPYMWLQDFTLFVVQRTSGDAIILGSPDYTPGDSSQFMRLGDPYALGGDRMLFANQTGGYADVSGTVVATARTSFSILEASRSGVAANNVTWRENGTARGSGTLAAGPTPLGQLMCVAAGGQAFATGYIAEVLVYDTALSGATMLSIRQALGTKYGITVV